jgi:hypothetical protein
MTDFFHSARLTFERAQYHIHDFKAVVDNFVTNGPYAEIIDKESEPGKEIHKVGIFGEIPQTLPCILFDAANNLRAVLDQSGYAAATASGHTNATKCNFPFGDTLVEIMSHINGRGAGKHLPSEILDLFLSFKPYKGPDDSQPSFLWALNKLCNTKKHRALIPLAIAEPHVNFFAEVPDGTSIGRGVKPDGTFSGWDPEKREMTLVTVPAGLNPHIRGHITFEIAIDGPEPSLSQMPAVRVIENMSSIVQGILMATETECRRLGFV